MKARPFSIYLLLCCVSIFFCLPARAFSISPAKVLVTIDPGASQTVSLKIINDDAATKIFKLIVVGVVQGSQGQPIFKSGVDIAESWVKFNKENILVPAHSQSEVAFEIKAPKQVYSGTHYLGLGVEESGEANGTVGIQGKIFSLVNLKVAGNAKESLQIKKFISLSKIGDWQMEAEFFNAGNVEVPYQVKAEVYNWANKNSSSQPVLGQSILIPQAQRNLLFSLSTDKFFWPGPYDVNLMVSYGLTGQTAVSMIKVWYWPVWSVIVLGVLFLVVIMGIIYWKLRKKKYAF